MATSSGRDTVRALAAVAAKLIGAAFGLGLNVVAARTLGIEGYGLFLLGLNVALLLSGFTAGGLPLSALRFLPAQLARGDHRAAARFKRVCVGATWAGSLGAVGLGAGVLWLFGGGLDAGVRAVIAAAAPALLVFALGHSYLALMQARMRVTEAELIFNTLRPALAVAAILALTRLAPEAATPAGLLWLVAGSAALALGLLALRLRRVERRAPKMAAAPARAPAPPDGWRQWLATGAVMLLILSGAALNERLDILMVSLLSGSSETAIYGAASRFAVIALLAVSAVGSYFLPRVSAAWSAGDRAAARAHAVRAARVAAGLALGVLAAMAAAGPVALGLFGAEFRAGQITMLILGAAFLIAAALGQGNGIAVVAGHPGVALRATAAGLTVNLALNLLLTPRYGAEGAAAATLVALTVTGAWGWAWCQRRLGLPTSALAALR